jgi:hypothetical protein
MTHLGPQRKAALRFIFTKSLFAPTAATSGLTCFASFLGQALDQSLFTVQRSHLSLARSDEVIEMVM